MGSFAVTFTGPDGTLLSAYTGDDGTTFTEHPSYTGHFSLLSGHATTPSGGAQALCMADWVPAGPDFSVSADMYIASTQVSRSGPAIRIQSDAKTFYYVRFRGGLVELMRVVAGTQFAFGSAPYSLTGKDGAIVPVTLAAAGSTITVSVSGSVVITQTDTNISTTGFAGMYWDNGSIGDGTGQSFDTLSATDLGGGGGVTPVALTGLSEGSGVTSASPVLAMILSGESSGTSTSLLTVLSALLHLTGNSTGSGGDSILSGAIPHALSGISVGSGDTDLGALVLAVSLSGEAAGTSSDTVSDVLQALALSASSNGHAGDIVRLISGLPAGVNDEFLGLLLWSLWLKYLEEWYRTT